MRLLLIEDDVRAAGFLLRGLSESGHVVDHAVEGDLGLALASEGIYDALIVDRRLPNLDGLALVRQLRLSDTVTPVLMLSATGAMTDRVEGMRAGCDDYLAKPYAFAEVLARLEALIRRAGRQSGDTMSGQDTLCIADLEIDTKARRVRRAGVDIPVQQREFLLLHMLVRHAGQVVSRSMLLEAAWTYDFEPRGNIIDMHIHRLRGKIDRNHDVKLIQTVPGAGYRLRAR